MQPSAGKAVSSGVGEREKLDTEYGRNGHALPVTRRPGSPSREGHARLELLSLQVLIHEIEHGHLAQLVGPDLRLVFLVHLHIGSVLVRHLDFGRMRRAPESGAHQLPGKRRLTKQAAQLVILRDASPSIGARQCCVGRIRAIVRIPFHAEAVLVQLQLLESRRRRRIQQHGMRIDAHTRYRLLGLTCPPALRPLLQHANAKPAFGQVRRGRHPIGPTTYDDNVEPFVLAHGSSPTWPNLVRLG